jgi:hypothetical protein
MIGGKIGQIFNLSKSEAGNFSGRGIRLRRTFRIARHFRSVRLWLGLLSARRPLSVAPLFVCSVADAAVSARRFDLIGKPRPNLRHLQHDGFGLFIHGGSRDL